MLVAALALHRGECARGAAALAFETQLDVALARAPPGAPLIIASCRPRSTGRLTAPESLRLSVRSGGGELDLGVAAVLVLAGHGELDFTRACRDADLGVARREMRDDLERGWRQPELAGEAEGQRRGKARFEAGLRAPTIRGRWRPARRPGGAGPSRCAPRPRSAGVRLALPPNGSLPKRPAMSGQRPLAIAPGEPRLAREAAGRHLGGQARGGERGQRPPSP